MKKITPILIAIMFLSCCIKLGRGLAEEESFVVAADRAFILFMEGIVSVKTPALNVWTDAEIGMALTEGDSIKTGEDSWAEIGIGEGAKNAIRIQENTILEFVTLEPVKLSLLKGELRALVEDLGRESTFELRTPTAVCGTRGTGWDTFTDGMTVMVDTYENEVFLYGLDESGNAVGEETILKAGRRGIMESPIKPVVITDVPVIRIEEWKEWKRDFKRRMGVETEEENIEEKAELLRKTQSNMESIMKGRKERNDKESMDKRLYKGSHED